MARVGSADDQLGRQSNEQAHARRYPARRRIATSIAEGSDSGPNEQSRIRLRDIHVALSCTGQCNRDRHHHDHRKRGQEQCRSSLGLVHLVAHCEDSRNDTGPKCVSATPRGERRLLTSMSDAGSRWNSATVGRSRSASWLARTLSMICHRESIEFLLERCQEEARHC